MIGKPEIMSMAGQLGLNPHVVEKDYALGWLLAGIFAHPKIAESWVFKGGTCLKKCFFDTYRFSEDLDFTLRDDEHLEAAFLAEVFAEIGGWVYERCGLDMPADKQDFEVFANPRGNRSCQGRISYRGPVSPTGGGWPRIKLDLTADERLVLPPLETPIFHPYSDAPENGIVVRAYAYEEAFAEKIRALAERTRPRDLYDVVNLYRNTRVRSSSAVILDVLAQKCAFKGIPVPRAADLEPHRAELAATWGQMLRHQLPELPPVDSFWDVLPEFFAWLESGVAPSEPTSYVVAQGETIIREHTARLPIGARQRSALEIIRFAAGNRLCVDLEYAGSIRRIEPYSLRRTAERHIILHAWSMASNEHRTYRVDRIQGARTTDQVFAPRYAIELTPGGLPVIPHTERSSRAGADPVSDRTALAVRRMAPRRRRSGRLSGPTHIYRCLHCGKLFYRKKAAARLNRHKDKSGLPCPGRVAQLVGMK